VLTDEKSQFFFDKNWLYKQLFVFYKNKASARNSINLVCNKMNHLHTNNLIHETSPYLLQHAHNPVNWYPWGSEALQKAKKENKVILVSIGYSACHWCHVMERESFEDEATALLMNDNFVNIKIDREERPDIDHIYMDAVQAITGSGGWPLNVFLTPDAKPFYGGTYFPPVKAFNRPSWTDILQSITKAWKGRRNELESQAENLTDYLKNSGNFISPDKRIIDASFENDFGFEQCESMFSAIMKSADTTWGGFGKAPKFPQTFVIGYLFQFYHYSGNTLALQQALLSVDKMLDGGIYDHLAGGLARYSTDNEWLAPHFEKMLYDNALLILILCDAFQITKQLKYKLAIDKTIAFVAEELRHNSGGFYAALDADSEGEEGKYYVWEKAEVDRILGSDAPLFCDFFDVTDQGNWEGKNILRMLKSQETFIREKQLHQDDFVQLQDRCVEKLKSERSQRVKPGLDDKIILSWNALMLKATAKAAVVLQNENYKELAVTNFTFLFENFSIGNNSCPLLHTWKNGIAKYPAFLDDYAYLADAALQLYEVSFDTAILQTAKDTCDFVIANFSDEEGVFFYFTHAGQDDVIVRKKEIYDGATPSANAVMAHNLLKLGVIFDLEAWRTRADKMLNAVASAVIKYPSSFGWWASLFLLRVKGSSEIAVIGSQSKSVASAIQSGFYLPGKILMAANTKNDSFPVLRNKMEGNPALIYVCTNYTCLAPLANLEEFSKANKTSRI